jgi:hypothetical protein
MSENLKESGMTEPGYNYEHQAQQFLAEITGLLTSLRPSSRLKLPSDFYSTPIRSYHFALRTSTEQFAGKETYMTEGQMEEPMVVHGWKFQMINQHLEITSEQNPAEHVELSAAAAFSLLDYLYRYRDYLARITQSNESEQTTRS